MGIDVKFFSSVGTAISANVQYLQRATKNIPIPI